jgi:heme/copper-type cytochrome/quinol oxidase subunit 2
VARVDPNYKKNWVKSAKYDELNASNGQRYVDSMYFVVSTMTGLGFSYTYPHTNLEYGMLSIIILIGVSIYVEFFAHFVVTLYNRNKKRVENMKRLEEAKKLEVLRNFP